MRKKVLIVDYDEKNLRQLREILSDFNVEVEEVHTGAEAFTKLKEERYSLVIASAMLSGINGFELTRKLRIELGFSKLPVILISSIYKGARYRYEALHVYGADHFFELPIKEDEFINSLKNYIPAKSAPLTTVKMTTLNLKEKTQVKKLEEATASTPPAQEKGLLTTEEIFGDLLKEVEEEKPKEAPLEEREEKPWEEPKKEQKKEKVKSPEEILEEVAPPAKRKKKAKSEEGFIDKILEETLSGVGISTKEKPKSEEKEKKEEVLEKVEEEKGKIKKEVEERKKEKIKEVPELEEEEKIPEEPFGPFEEKQVLGEYILLEKISTGGMAEIYKAKKKGVEGFEKVVALKKILPHLSEDEEFITMFIDEAKVASKLTHPNIAQIYDLGKIDGAYFIAMEYILGKDLRTILKKLRKRGKKFVPIDLSSYIIMKMCEALDYAHRKVGENGKPLNIVHRDVSPQNILISYEGEIKLVDFGVAKASIKAHHTVAGSLKGKFLYMSPEQAKGSKIDYRSDIFSLGSIYYEILTGIKAFIGDSEAQVLDRVKNCRFIPPSQARPGIPEEAERIILKAMQLNPDKRYQHASEMRNDIERFLLSYIGSIPNARDMAVFMYSLFQDEIKSTGIEVEIIKEKPKEAPVVKELEKPEEVRKSEEAKAKVPVRSFGFEPAKEKAKPVKARKIEERKAKGFPSVVFIFVVIILLIGGGGAYYFTRMRGKALVMRHETAPIENTAKENPPAQTQEEVQPLKTNVEKGTSQISEEAVKKNPVPSVAVTPPVKKVVQKPEKRKIKRRPQPKKVQVKEEKGTQVIKPETQAKEEIPKPKPAEKPIEKKPKKEIIKKEPKEKVPSAKFEKPQIKEGSLVAFPFLDRKPQAINKVAPRKPSFLRKSGVVTLSVLISPYGDVEQVKVIKSLHPRYDESAISAVKKWKFTSPIKSGKKVRTWMVITIKF